MITVMRKDVREVLRLSYFHSTLIMGDYGRFGKSISIDDSVLRGRYIVFWSMFRSFCID